MGRRFIVTVAVAATAVGLSAGPALAQTHSLRSFSDGTHRLSQRVVRAHDAPSQYRGDATIARHGMDSECTVPTPKVSPGGYTNIFSRDTSIVFDSDGATGIDGTYVGTCSADLTTPQNVVQGNGVSTKKGLVNFSKSYETYGEVCILTLPKSDYFHAPYTPQGSTITVQPNQLQGDAESIAYSDGEFVETCIANAAPLA